jgi:hypothetical protein
MKPEEKKKTQPSQTRDLSKSEKKARDLSMSLKKGKNQERTNEQKTGPI